MVKKYPALPAKSTRMCKKYAHSGLFSPEKSGPLGQVRDIWLCLRVLSPKSQIPSTKKQTSSKLQAPNYK